MSGLNPRQQAFADEYIITGNATQSAIKAGYSEKTAEQQASRLLRNVKVQDYIEERMKLLSKDTIASQEEVLKHLTRVMRREEEEHQVVTLRSKREQWVPVGGDGQLKKMVIESEEEKIVPIPTKVNDTNKAAELLGRRYAMWTDKQQVEISEAPTFVDDISGDDDG
jgi:phage terminase small subunit